MHNGAGFVQFGFEWGARSYKSFHSRILFSMVRGCHNRNAEPPRAAFFMRL